ncbi:MAG: nuclear transport factor 2 family protein [Gammaproteobacteria bacterium]
MKSLYVVISGMALALMLAACQGTKPADTLLTRTDGAFSMLSEQQGFAAAFQRYALDDAVLLPDNRGPLESRNTIEQSLQALPAGSSLSWTLQGADTSGDLGYTWGVYTFIGGNAAGQTTAAYGKYLSVWKRQSGDWKLAVMMINESPGPAG